MTKKVNLVDNIEELRKHGWTEDEIQMAKDFMDGHAESSVAALETLEKSGDLGEYDYT